MGDIADMMLDGTLCTECGEYLGSTLGYPQRCAGCGGDDSEPMSAAGAALCVPRGGRARRLKPAGGPVYRCKKCSRPFRSTGALSMHTLAKHPKAAAPETPKPGPALPTDHLPEGSM